MGGFVNSIKEAFQRQLFEQRKRDNKVRAVFISQHPELADQVHEGSVDLANCRCPLCEHIRQAAAGSLTQGE